MDGHIRIIEVNGHKFEVDLRTAKKVDQFKVGDKVKILKKKYGDSYESHPGVIVGIDCFKNLPTIVVAYLGSVFHNDGKLEFAYLNAKSDDIEICPMSEDDVLPNRETIVMFFDRSIAAKQLEIDQIVARKEYFIRQYGTTFGVGKEEVGAATFPAQPEPF